MSIKNIAKTIKTYRNPFWFYVVCMKWTRKTIVPISLRNGLIFFVRTFKNDLFVVHEVFANSEYDAALKGIDQIESIVIDVGAHIGTFSIKASQSAMKVYSYEPDEENNKILNKNLRVNKCKNVKSFKLGISSKAGNYKFYSSSTNSSCNTMFEEFSRNAKATSITCTTLSEAIKANGIKKIDLLKLDCEGAEYQILMSLKEAQFVIIERIIFEYQDAADGSQSHKDIIVKLKQQGFKIRKLNVMNNSTGTILAFK